MRKRVPGESGWREEYGGALGFTGELAGDELRCGHHREREEEDDGWDSAVSALELKRGREGWLAFGPARQAAGPAQFM
jgi:hypothetical protein